MRSRSWSSGPVLAPRAYRPRRRAAAAARGVRPSAVAQQRDLGGALVGTAGGLEDHRGAGGADDLDQRGGLDLPVRQRGVPVAAGAGLVPRVVAVHQVDPPGDGPDVVDDGLEVEPAGLGVAGVEDEARRRTRRPRPTAGDRVEVTGHRLVPAGGVLDQHRQPEPALVRLAGERLAPVVEPDWPGRPRPVTCPPCTTIPLAPELGRRRGVRPQQLAAGDPDPVVGRRHVERVRARGRRRRGPWRRSSSARGCGLGAFQSCGSARKICTAVGARRRRLRERVGVVVAGADVDAEDGCRGHADEPNDRLVSDGGTGAGRTCDPRARASHPRGPMLPAYVPGSSPAGPW